MPDQNPNFLMQFLQWSWLILLEVGRRLSNRIDKLEGKAEQNKDDLHKQKVKHLEDKEDMVTHAYIKDEIKPMFDSLNKQLQLVLKQTSDIIKRPEHQAAIDKIDNKVVELHKRVDGLK
jgi:hypothetical protein